MAKQYPTSSMAESQQVRQPVRTDKSGAKGQFLAGDPSS